MSNNKDADFEGSNELQQSVSENSPIYLREDDLSKINFITTPRSNTYDPVAESGLLFLDAHGDKELHSRIVELAQEHSHEPNLSKDSK